MMRLTLVAFLSKDNRTHLSRYDHRHPNSANDMHLSSNRQHRLASRCTTPIALERLSKHLRLLTDTARALYL